MLKSIYYLIVTFILLFSIRHTCGFEFTVIAGFSLVMSELGGLDK